MTHFLDTAALIDTLIERLDDGDVTNVSIGRTYVHVSVADPDALARIADLLGGEPYLLPRTGTPNGLFAEGHWRGQAVTAGTGFAVRATPRPVVDAATAHDIRMEKRIDRARDLEENFR